jgi:hypothetical protein
MSITRDQRVMMHFIMDNMGHLNEALSGEILSYVYN